MTNELRSLGQTTRDFVGLDVIPLSREMNVTFTSDEVTALCPVTSQPDLYVVEIKLSSTRYSLESKSLKLYLGTFRDQGIFAEELSGTIMTAVSSAIARAMANDGRLVDTEIEVTIFQKSRGGITIRATAKC